MKKNLLLILGISLMAGACHTEDARMEKLCRKWQEVSVENPQYEAAVAREMANLDTLKDSDTAMLKGVYGTASADSAKVMGKAAIAQQRVLQEEVVKGTWFLFSKDGKLQMHSPKGTDNANWELKDDRLTITKSGTTAKKEWKITHLSDTALHIVASNSNISFNVRFQPAAQ